MQELRLILVMVPPLFGDLIRRVVNSSGAKARLDSMAQLRHAYELWLESSGTEAVQSGHGPAD